MKESDLRAHFKNVVKLAGGTASPHEDKYSSGYPDLDYVIPDASSNMPRKGWVEFKLMSDWPKRESTAIRLGIRPDQRAWIRTRLPFCDVIFICARIADDIYLFEGKYVDELYEPIARGRLEQLWVGKWKRSIDASELKELL